jgi:hypothetical protein
MGMSQLSPRDENILKNLCEVLGATFGGKNSAQRPCPGVCLVILHCGGLQSRWSKHVQPDRVLEARARARHIVLNSCLDLFEFELILLC